MGYKIALVGNPNSGKTTLYNALTGSNQYVGNWAGVTVEKKEGTLRLDAGVTLTDLPGIYSLSPYTLEEVVARNYLLEEQPDAILNIIDGTNLERNLYLTTQLMELGIPVVAAINMMDAVSRRGDHIDTDKLAAALGCEVVTISALKNEGIEDAARLAVAAAKRGESRAAAVFFSGIVEHALAHIEEALLHEMPESRQRFYSVKLFERDRQAIKDLQPDAEKLKHIEEDIRRVEEALGDDAEAIIIGERYSYIERLLGGVYDKKSAGRLSATEKIDRIVTHRVLALPIFALLMFLVYYLSIGSLGRLASDFITDTVFGAWITPALTGALTEWGVAAWLVSLISEGILGGVGAVLGFAPQMFLLFFLLSILEDCGYMSRVAFIMDRLFRRFGLSGKSFIPMLVATGCSVPGIMASRTIEEERDRRMTVMTTAFMPCGAKMPLVALIAGAVFGGSAWIATSAYFLGVASIVISGLILKKTKPFSGDASPFVMELPAYHAPVAANILRTTWDRGFSYIKRAGSVILAASVALWVLNSISFSGGIHYLSSPEEDASILKAVGGVLAPLFAPLGFGSWQPAVATLLGLLAKEEIVGTFGTLASMSAGAGGINAVIAGEFFGGSSLAAFSFMTFNLLCAPCVAAMNAIRREMASAKWTAFAIGYMCVFAYGVSLMIYQFGSVFSGTGNLPGTLFAAAACILLVYFLFRKNPYQKKRG